jgi:hypothetical protein
MVTSVQVVEISILRYVPEMLAWLVGIVLAVLMVRRGGGKAEKLLLAGCSLMFAVKLVTPLLSEVVQSLSQSGMSYEEIANRMSLFSGIPTSVLALAGLVCLVIAFWARFRAKRQEPA